MPKSLINDSKYFFTKYACHKDRQNFQDEWQSPQSVNKLEKFLAFIEKILKENLKRLNQEQHNPVNVLKEEGSMFSIENSERVTKFNYRFSKMVKIYYVKSQEADQLKVEARKKRDQKGMRKH